MKTLVFLIPWLLQAMAGMSSGPSCTVLDGLDGSSLLHSELRLHEPVDPSKAFTMLAQRLVQRAGEHLQDFEVKMQTEQNGIRSLRRYMEEVHGSFGKAGTIFSELHGLLPAGKASKADTQILVTFLDLLREKAFAKATLATVGDLRQAIISYTARTERHVSELMHSSAKSTEKELPQLIRQFFLAQRQIVSSLVEKLQGSVEKVLVALPSNHSHLAKVAGPLIRQLANYTNEYVAWTVKNITDTNGTHFCGNVDTVLMDEIFPTVNETLRVLPRLEVFAKSNVPEAAVEVGKIAKQLREVSNSKLVPLKKHAHAWTDKICSLIAAASPTP